MIEQTRQRLLQDIRIRKDEHEQAQAEMVKAIFDNHPELKALHQQEIRETKDVAKSMIQGMITEEELDLAMSDIDRRYREKREALYEQLGIDQRDFEIHYDCPLCQDTGKQGTKDCQCLRQKIAETFYREQNLLDEDLPSLEELNLNYYEDEQQRESISETLSSLKKLTQSFEEHPGYSLIFYGKPGVGKTFISNALAKSLTKKGYFVFYQSSPDLLTNDFKKRDALEAFLLSCDLLIIDDLGKEHLTEKNRADFFSIIDKRIKSKKSFLISTNESPLDLQRRYGDAVFSRLRSVSGLYEFIGPSLR